jgi:O-antigen ligase
MAASDSIGRGEIEADAGSGVAASGRYAAACLFALLFLVCIGLQPLRSTTSFVASGEGDLLRQAAYSLVFVAAMLASWRTGWIRTVPFTLLLLMGWCWLSLIWAIEPAIATRRLLLTTFIFAIAFAAVEAAGTVRALKAIAALLLVNYLAVALSPQAVHQPGESVDFALVGNWRGVTNHKNYVGAICAVTVIVLMLGPRLVRPLLNLAAIAAALYFLWRTQSKTSMAMLAFALGIAGLYLIATPRGRRLLMPATLLALLLVQLAFGAEIMTRISDYLSEPAALTGRTDIWVALLDYAHANPWLGAGYGSFWDIGPDGPMMGLGWVEEVLTGHNGYLDLLVQVGVPGLALAVVGMIVVPLWRATQAGDAYPRQGALLLSLLVFSIGHNFLESSLLSRDLVVGVVFLLAVALTGKFSREVAATRAPAAGD